MVGYTAQQFIFDNMTQLTIIAAIVVMYLRTRELYSLSLQKGIKYLNLAMLFYFFNIGGRYVITVFDFFTDRTFGTFDMTTAGLVLSTVSLFAATMGGFFLAYCLVWRRFEREEMGLHARKALWLYLAAAVIVAIDLYLMVGRGFITAFLFFGTMVAVLSYAIVSNYIQCCKQSRGSKDINPFLALAGMGLGVYVVLFIETLVRPFLFTIHFYAWGLATMFTLAFLYQVVKVVR
jgi:hypothetical protein